MKRERGWVERGDCRIYYERAGEGPPLIFAHGLGGNHLSWWQQVPHFSRNFTCVTFSHRGFFPSTSPDSGIEPHQFGPDLAALIDQLGLTGVVVVAQSMGGWSTIEYALTEPAALKAIVLSATSGRIDVSGLDGVAAWRAASDQAMAAGHARGEHPAAGARMAREQPHMHYLYRAMDELSTLDKTQMRHLLFESRNRPVADLSGVKVPTLWITGEEDFVFASPAGPALARATPHGEHVRLPNVGHSGYFQDPAAFNRELDAFLARLG